MYKFSLFCFFLSFLTKKCDFRKLQSNQVLWKFPAQKGNKSFFFFFKKYDCNDLVELSNSDKHVCT